jgi:D-alanyl-D-alanine carboxypeptidase
VLVSILRSQRSFATKVRIKAMRKSKNLIGLRLRRIFILSFVSAITIVGVSLASMPTKISNHTVNLPESIERLVELITPKPVTIFDPPIYSIDEADSLWLVVNKQRPVPDLEYQPENLAFPEFPNLEPQNPKGSKLRQEAAVATEQLAAAMKAAGEGDLILTSGFRSYTTQKKLYMRSKSIRGVAAAEQLVARPGHSEHQLGLAADFSARGPGCVTEECFSETRAGIWLKDNAHIFGFIVRYPKGFEAITGFQYEPWHFRYVGIELATEMKTLGIETLEEFWGLGAAPDYVTPAG